MNEIILLDIILSMKMRGAEVKRLNRRLWYMPPADFQGFLNQVTARLGVPCVTLVKGDTNHLIDFSFGEFTVRSFMEIPEAYIKNITEDCIENT